ncbi:MAG: uroporphyrinogen decarboxylase family protein, partial [Cocleimonas sp.]
MAETGCDALGLDWTQDISQARERVGDKVALQGNMDPSVLYGSAEVVRAEAKKVLDGFGKGAGHVFNLGHGIHQHVDPDNVSVLVDAVHEFGQQD